MITVNDCTTSVETPRPRRAPRKPGDPTPKGAPVRVAKSKDAGMVKVSLYLPVQTAEKLAVGSILRRVDQSDLANEILTRELSSVTYYDRSASRSSGEPLPVREIDRDSAA